MRRSSSRTITAVAHLRSGLRTDARGSSAQGIGQTYEHRICWPTGMRSSWHSSRCRVYFDCPDYSSTDHKRKLERIRTTDLDEHSREKKPMRTPKFRRQAPQWRLVNIVPIMCRHRFHIQSLQLNTAWLLLCYRLAHRTPQSSPYRPLTNGVPSLN